MKSIFLTTIASFTFVFFTINLVQAGGFQVNLQGTKSLGMGHCGTGFSLGTSSQFFNPGAFSFTDSLQIELNGNAIFANVQYLEPTPGIATTSIIKSVGTPFSFFASYRPKNTKINAGIAIYTPFGSGIQYPDNWAGQFVIREMKLKTIFMQPTLGYQINDKIGIGGGFVIGYGDFLLRKALPIQDQNGTYGEGILTGQSVGYGYNLGLLYKVNDGLSFGMSYRSSLKVSTDAGQATFTTPSYLAEYFPDTPFGTTIQLPWVGNFGISKMLSEKTMLTADVNFVGWNTYDTLGFDFELNTDKLADVASPRKYNNVMIFRLGALHGINESLSIRAGAYYDFTPVEDSYITPESPDVNKLGITGGASYQIGTSLEVNVALLYITGNPRTATNAETGFGGTWKSSALIPSFSLGLSI